MARFRVHSPAIDRATHLLVVKIQPGGSNLVAVAGRQNALENPGKGRDGKSYRLRWPPIERNRLAPDRPKTGGPRSGENACPPIPQTTSLLWGGN